jgi:hypothetical protein
MRSFEAVAPTANSGANPDFLPRSTGQGRVCAFSKERRMKFAHATKFNRKSGEAMTVRTTKITIETEGLLVIRQAQTVVTWCPGCQAEVDVVLLGEDTAQLLRGLPTDVLHIWSPPEGPVLICLRSLVQRSHSNDV